MSSKPSESTPTVEAPPQSSKPSASAKRRAKKKAAGKSNPVDSNPKDPSLGYSEGKKYLETFGLSISGRKEVVSSNVRSEGYFHSVQVAYQELLNAKKDIAAYISYAEWRHIHALMLYARIQNVQFETVGVKQPARTRIPLPYNLRVFQPIWALLSEIGVVEDSELFVKYIPVAAMPRDPDQEDPDDIDEILECIQYPWKESWAQAKEAREERNARKDAYSLNIPENQLGPLLSEEEIEASKTAIGKATFELKQILKLWTPAVTSEDPLEATSARFNVDATMFGEGNRFPSFSFDGTLISLESEIEIDTTEFNHTVRDSGTRMYKELAAAAKALKFSRMTSRPVLKLNTPTFTLGCEPFVGDPGAYGEYCGWDSELWMSYQQLVETVSPIALFSLSFPREVTGTYAWLLPVKNIPELGLVVRLPKASVPTVVWLTALLLDSSTLPDQRTCTWYGVTDSTPSVVLLRKGYIAAAVKSGAPTEVFR